MAGRRRKEGAFCAGGAKRGWAGGYALSPYTYRLFRIDRHAELAQGAEALLLEYMFLDNAGDAQYWKDNWKELVAAVAAGSAEYWQLDAAEQPLPKE